MERFAAQMQARMTPREEEIVEESLREFNQLVIQRSTFGSQWEEVAQIVAPNSRGTFQYGDFRWQGEKKTERQIDATGMMALRRFGAICDSMVSPRNLKWHGVTASNPALKKNRQVQIYFQRLTELLFQFRYNPLANFSGQNAQNFTGVGAFGNACMFIDQLDTDNYPFTPGLRYKAVPLGETFFHENHQGMVDGMCRWFRLTPRQAFQKWSKTGRVPPQIMSALDAKSEMPFNFIHRVGPRSDYDPEATLTPRGKPWFSYYISIEGRMLLEETGYQSFPFACARYEQAPGEVYGRGPAMDVLPSLKTLNAEKGIFLKAGHRIADPVLLGTDDGVVDLNMTPGAFNAGGVSADGQPLIHTVPIGSLPVMKEMMEDERSLIKDAFLVTLFQILVDTPQMTATEVVERLNEKGMLIAPTMGRIQDEYLGQIIPREIDVLSQLGLLPKMPPILKEAKGEYQIVYTSPLSKAMRAGEASGFLRTVESALNVAAQMQDPSILDPFDFTTAYIDIADINGVPPSWMASPDQMVAKQKNRARQMAQKMQIQAAPAQAAMMKAQAAQAKAGMGQPQQGQPPGPGQ